MKPYEAGIILIISLILGWIGMFLSQYFTNYAISLMTGCCEIAGNMAEGVDRDNGGCCPSEEFYRIEMETRNMLYKEAKQKEIKSHKLCTAYVYVASVSLMIVPRDKSCTAC